MRHDAIGNQYEQENRDFSVLTAKVVIVFLALLGLSLAFRPKGELISRPLTEDGYYSLAVARNIAEGKGITTSGGEATNGFQPLFTFVTVPAFWAAGGDRFEAIRFVLILQWLLWLATAWIVGLVAKDGMAKFFPAQSQRLFWWTVLLYAGSSWIFMAAFNGLETGCEVFIYSILWRYYQLGKHETRGGLIGFGAILGLLVLARIDSVFFVIIISLFLFKDSRGRPFMERVMKFATVGGTAFIVSLPWWAYNVLTFGSLMPISGKAEETWLFSFHRLSIAGEALLRVMVPYLYFGETHFEGQIADLARLLVLAACIWLLGRAGFRLRRKSKPDGADPTARTAEFATIMFATMLALLMWYMLSSFATWFYVRYITPLSIVSTVVIAAAALKAFGKPKHIHAAIPIAIAIPLCLITYELHAGGVSNQYFDQQVYLVEKYVPQNDLVGAKQSGTLGYCRDNVVNLDGKVNPQVDRPGFVTSDYLRERNINWLCDWTWMVVPPLTGDNPEANGWKLVASTRKFVLYHRMASNQR
jgi:hypothetical protein